MYRFQNNSSAIYLMEEFTKFSIYSVVIGAARFILGVVSVSSFNYAAEKQVIVMLIQTMFTLLNQ